MTERLDELALELSVFKKELARMWDAKGRTDQEVLDLSIQMDALINEWHRLNPVINNNPNFNSIIA